MAKVRTVLAHCLPFFIFVCRRPSATTALAPRNLQIGHNTAAAMEFRADASPPGLYATKAYNVGDVILDEAPLFVFRPLSSGDDKSISAQFKNVTSDPEAAAKKAAAAAAGGGSSAGGGCNRACVGAAAPKQCVSLVCTW